MLTRNIILPLAPKFVMASRPWTLKAGRVVPHGYPHQIIVPDADVRLRRGHVSPAGKVRVPAGNAGTTVVVCVKRLPDVKALGGCSAVATGAWLAETDSPSSYDIPTSVFAGLFPQYRLEEQEGRQKLLDRIKALAKRAGSTRARLMPDFLTKTTHIMSCIRKLADWDKLMVRPSLFLVASAFQRSVCRSFSMRRTRQWRGPPSTGSSSG